MDDVQFQIVHPVIDSVLWRRMEVKLQRCKQTFWSIVEVDLKNSISKLCDYGVGITRFGQHLIVFVTEAEYFSKLRVFSVFRGEVNWRLLFAFVAQWVMLTPVCTSFSIVNWGWASCLNAWEQSQHAD